MVKQSVSKQEERSDSSSSKYKGVRKRKWGKFVSEIRLPNSRERIWLGSYDTAEKAARAFDAALFCLRGRSAKFNFPDNPPEIAGGRSLSRPEIQEAAARFANSEETRICDSNRSSLQLESSSPSVSDHSSSQLESPSPSVSDGSTVQLLDHELTTLDGSFWGPKMDPGSGNVSDYGIFPGFDDFSSDFLAQPPPPPLGNFDYGEENFDGVCNFAQESFLWNF